MAESSVNDSPVAEKFLVEVCGVLPDITPDCLRKLLDYLKSAGVLSKDDIDKVDENELAIAFLPYNARALMNYFKNKGSLGKEPPFSAAVKSSLDVKLPVAVKASARHQEGGRHSTDELLDQSMMLQKMEGEKNREMVLMMKKMQEQTLSVVSSQMKQMAQMQSRMINQMSQQMTEQNELHRGTIAEMIRHMECTTAMQAETLKTVQEVISRTQSTNERTLNRVLDATKSASQKQDKHMAEIRDILHEKKARRCAIM